MENSNIIIDKTHIQELIPQKWPMVMVDNLIYNNEKKTICNLTIEKDNIFIHDNKFREPGLIENIAQTTAVHVGYICFLKNIPIPLGFIGAIKNFELHFLPNIYDTIQTEIIIEREIFNVTMISATICRTNEIVAKCELTLFLDNSN